MITKILSWNIWSGKYISKVTAFIKNFNADIIGLQEATQTPEGNNKIAEHIAKQFGYYYAYAPSIDARAWGKPYILGNAVLSKFPIISTATHYLSEENTINALQADIKINSEALHVFSTHLKHAHQLPSPIQEEQARTLVTKAPKENTIIMGDFNATPESKTIEIMEKKFQKADGESKTPTWSVYKRTEECCKEIYTVTVRLDYIFVSPDISVKKFSIEKSDGSDHLPIAAEVVIKKAIA